MLWAFEHIAPGSAHHPTNHSPPGAFSHGRQTNPRVSGICQVNYAFLDIRFLFAENSHLKGEQPMAITRRQREVYDFLQRFVEEHGYSPSYEEIGEGLGLSSPATVHKHISNLEQKGLLTRKYNQSRSIDVVKMRGRPKLAAPLRAVEELRLPLVGTIAAGRPLEAVENPESISLGDFTRSKDVYVLRVKGESMQDEHIVDGDYVLVEKTKTARNGEIVVALVGKSEATLKRLYLEGQKIRLQPSNASMQPIIVPAAEVDIQGRVIGVLRKY
jgi:repressor LexA